MDLATAQRKKVKRSSARSKKLSEVEADGFDMDVVAAQPPEDVKLPTEAQLPTVTNESEDFWDELIIDGFAIASFKSADDLQDWIRKTEETTKLEKFCREDQNCRKRGKNPQRKCNKSGSKMLSNCCENSTDGSVAHENSPVNCTKLQRSPSASLCDPSGPDHNCNNCGSLSSAKQPHKDSSHGDMVVKDEVESTTTISTEFHSVKLPKEEVTEEKESHPQDAGPVSNKVTNGHRPSPSAANHSPQPDTVAECQKRSEGNVGMKPVEKSTSPGKDHGDRRLPKGADVIQTQSAESQLKLQPTTGANQRPSGPDLSSFAASAANMLSAAGLPTYLPTEGHHRQHGHIHSYPFPGSLPTGMPSNAGVQQLFGLSGLNGLPMSSLNGLPGLGVTPFAAIPAAAGPVPMGSVKKRGKWCAMHVRIAWEIHRRQQELRQAANDGKPASGTFPPSAISASAPLPTLNPPSISALSSGHPAHMPGVQSSSSKFPSSSPFHSNGLPNGYGSSAEIAARREKLIAEHERERRDRGVEAQNGGAERSSRSFENGHNGANGENRDRSRSPFRSSSSGTNLAALAHLSSSTQAAAMAAAGISAFNNVLNGPMTPTTPNGKERIAAATVGPEDGLLYRQHEILQERLKNERPEANKSADASRNSSGHHHHTSNAGSSGRSEVLKHSMSNSFLSPAPPASTAERSVKSVTPSSISSSAGRMAPYLYGHPGMSSSGSQDASMQQFPGFSHLGLLASAGADPYRNFSAAADFQAMMAARQRSELSQQFASQSSFDKERQEQMLRLEQLNAQMLSQHQSASRGSQNPLAPMIDWERLMSAGRMSGAPRGTPDPFLLACAGLGGSNSMLGGADRQGHNGADQRLMAELAERNKMLAAAAAGMPNLDSFRALNFAAQMGVPPGFFVGPNSLSGMDPNRNFAASLSALGPTAHLFPPGASQFAAMMAPPYSVGPAGTSASASKILEQLVRQKNGSGPVKDGGNPSLAQMAADLQSR